MKKLLIIYLLLLHYFISFGQQEFTSPDGKKNVELRNISGDRSVVSVNSVPHRSYQTIVGQKIYFFTDSNNVMYIAKCYDGDFCVVTDGIEGPHYKRIPGNTITFSPDNNHYAYKAVVDEKKSKKFYVIDGKEQPSYHNLLSSDITFSPDSKHWAYGASDDDRWFYIIDGVKEPDYDGLLSEGFVFSPDNKRLAYGAKANDRWFYIIDGVKEPEYDDLMSNLTFSPDSKRVAYAASSDNEWFFVIDGIKQPHYNKIAENGITFSPDSKHWAYAVVQFSSCFYILDGVEQNPYPIIYSFEFSPDSKHWRFMAQRSSKFIYVVDGKETTDSYNILFSEKKSNLYSNSGEKQVINNYSKINFDVINNTWTFDPIRIWLNDSLIFREEVALYSYPSINLLKDGNLKLTAQLGDLGKTKVIYNLNADYRKEYKLEVRFTNKNRIGTINKLNESTLTENLIIIPATSNKEDELSLLENHSENNLAIATVSTTAGDIALPAQSNESNLANNASSTVTEELTLPAYDYERNLQSKSDSIPLEDLTISSISNEEGAVIIDESKQTGSYDAGHKDLILRKNGEQVFCKITKVDSTNIYFKIITNNRELSTSLSKDLVAEYKTNVIAKKEKTQKEEINLNYKGNLFCIGFDPLNIFLNGPTITGELTLQKKGSEFGVGILSGYRFVSMGWAAKELLWDDLKSSSHTIPIACRIYYNAWEKLDGAFVGPYMEFGKLMYPDRENEFIKAYGIEWGYKNIWDNKFTFELSVIQGILKYGTPGNWLQMYYPAVSCKFGITL
ncbi:MAG: hypothetical protein JW894_01795 [Bacteroidales bacterium]|nr:hypothetical protein [Bacteroidales bacterium]